MEVWPQANKRYDYFDPTSLAFYLDVDNEQA